MCCILTELIPIITFCHPLNAEMIVAAGWGSCMEDGLLQWRTCIHPLAHARWAPLTTSVGGGQFLLALLFLLSGWWALIWICTCRAA